ncbi:hypothetical protein ACLBXM_08870 [Xanthobacteraceae bacterium A53D]
MVVVSDKILRIVAPSGRPATTAALYKLLLKEKALERQISEMKGASRTSEANLQAGLRRLENALKDVQKQMEPLKAQLQELKEQEDKEAEAQAVVREAALRKGKDPHTLLSQIDLASLGRK